MNRKKSICYWRQNVCSTEQLSITERQKLPQVILQHANEDEKEIREFGINEFIQGPCEV